MLGRTSPGPWPRPPRRARPGSCPGRPGPSSCQGAKVEKDKGEKLPESTRPPGLSPPPTLYHTASTLPPPPTHLITNELGSAVTWSSGTRCAAHTAPEPEGSVVTWKCHRSIASETRRHSPAAAEGGSEGKDCVGYGWSNVMQSSHDSFPRIPLVVKHLPLCLYPNHPLSSTLSPHRQPSSSSPKGSPRC